MDLFKFNKFGKYSMIYGVPNFICGQKLGISFHEHSVSMLNIWLLMP